MNDLVEAGVAPYPAKSIKEDNLADVVGMSEGTEVKVDGNEITISSVDKEKAGLMAAKIENLCRVSNRDIRIFQDGCYITHKAGKDLV